MIFNAMVVTNEEVDVEEFLMKNNEYIAEPNNGDGCIVSLKLKEIELSNQKNYKKENKKELSDKLDRYMHFAFRGMRFTVDTEERTVVCNGAGLVSEMEGERDSDGLYSLNVEQSN